MPLYIYVKQFLSSFSWNKFLYRDFFDSIKCITNEYLEEKI